MIWFIITEPVEKAGARVSYHAAKYLLEECAGDVCLEINFSQVSERQLAEARPWAIVHSGGPTPIDEYGLLEHPGYGACLREWDVPQFAICKGHQLAGRMLGGAEVAPMRALLPGEKDPDSTYYPGFMKEQGVMDVEVLKDDPVLGPAGKTLRVSQSHAEELKAVPSGFEVLARSPLCAIQAMRRKSGPIFYATQFHPERRTRERNDGVAILKRFFGLAKESAGKTSSRSPRK